MTKGSPLLTFTIQEPYPVALRMVRRALALHWLRVPSELDISSRMKHEMGAGIAPCTLLFVDDPALLLEAIVFDRGAAFLIPQRLVVSSAERHTEIQFRSGEALLEDGAPATVCDPLLSLHTRIVQAMESVAERHESHFTVSTKRR